MSWEKHLLLRLLKLKSPCAEDKRGGELSKLQASASLFWIRLMIRIMRAGTTWDMDGVFVSGDPLELFRFL